MLDSDIPPEARKHTRITQNVSLLAWEIRPDWIVYMATYTAGRAGQPYQRAEEQSGKEFWSIKAYDPSFGDRLKDPDVILVRENRVKFLIEVKWGTVPGKTNTDLRLNQVEQDEMARLMATLGWCRVRGPAVKGGRRYRSEEFTTQKDFVIDKETKLILVSDLVKTETSLPGEFGQFLSLSKRMKATFQIADIERRVGEIPSLREVLEATLQAKAI